MRYPIITYKIIAVLSFTILSVVQVFLVFNTYQLENERYYFSEKSSINEYYTKLITNEKLYPGGQRIIDTVLNRNIPVLAHLYSTNRSGFNTLKQKICDSIFTTLRAHQPIGTFISDYKTKRHLKDSLEYALTVEAIELMLDKGNYATLYNKKEHYPLIHKSYQHPEGIRIGGNLKNPDMQNRATWLSVSIPTPRSYKIIFALYVDTHDRTMMIAKKMMPVLGLSLLSLLINVWLFFITFRNWLRQKKLAEMKTDFINSITHEFNTPIAAITVANKSLQNEKIIDRKENIKALSDVIQRQIGRLQKLVGQVLDLTTLNQLTLHKEPYSIHGLLDEILLDYKLNLSDKGVELDLVKKAGQDIASLDRFYFTTMLLNILDNGIKYNNKQEKKIIVSTANSKKEFQLSIRDNGIGLTEETKKNMFRKFYRNTTNNLEQATGLGLGLYYVKQCVDAHGWSIAVESTTGEGTLFIITIPY